MWGAVFLLLTVAEAAAEPRHAVLLREAAVAIRAGDATTALARTEEAAALRPDYPRIQLNLARLYASSDQPARALAALQRLAEMGLQLKIESDPALAALREKPEFKALAKRLATPATEPASADAAAFTLLDMTGIVESCLVDPETLLWYFGDVRNRCVWLRDVTGGLARMRPFTSPDDKLDGVFRLALSPDRKTLWAATGTVAAMTGDDAEDGKRTALVAIDSSTGRVRERHEVPADGHKHLLGDFVVNADGSILATDSFSPVIWRLSVDGQLERWLEHDDFASLQGIVVTSDGKTLYVSDYGNGIWRIDVATKAITRLEPPDNATFFGLDGLALAPEGLIAVQNGITPQRVLFIKPATSGKSSARVLTQGLPDMTDLALGQAFNGHFHFVSNSGWALFDPPTETASQPRTVTIYSVPLNP